MLIVNERPHPFREGMRMGDLVDEIKPQADVLLLNGMVVGRDALLQDGDICSLIHTGEIPSALEMEQALEARHSPEVQEKLRKATVGIMGLGGLGSAAAVSLVKVGVGRLILADHDVVVLSNIHRQHYFIDQIGRKKTRALKSTLVHINPFVAVETRDVKLDGRLIREIFAGVDVLLECFDNPAMKAVALRTVLNHMPGIGYVGASGLAGYATGNTIRTRKIRSGIYIVGDDESDVRTTGSLIAPRVGIAAHHQANQAVRILLGIDEP